MGSALVVELEVVDADGIAVFDAHFLQLFEEAAVANAEYIYYASPNRLVYENETYLEDMGEEAIAILYPDMENFTELYNHYAYRNLNQDLLSYINSLWETLMIN